MNLLKKRLLIPLLKTVLFLLIVVFLAGKAQYYLQYRERYNDNSSFQVINFYKEDKNAMDAVFIGSSCTFSYYSPLLAYKNYGVKTTNYSSSGMGMLAYRYAIEEVRKTQKDALIILTVTPSEEMQYLGVHFMADYMPLSLNKIRFLTRYFTQDGESILNSLGFYFTLMEYHDRWAEVTPDDFIIDEGIKGATRHKYYLNTVNDLTEYCETNDENLQLSEKALFLMEDLLDYCDEKNENIVFLFPPKAYTVEEFGQMNTLIGMISDRGYRVLDLRDEFSQLHLDITQDFYDIDHTNIHGSIKYTDQMMQYILNERKCTTVADQKWDAAVEKYSHIVETSVLDVETDMKHRDYDLEKPESIEVKQEGNDVLISWNDVENAEEYHIYRKYENGFEKIGETAELSYIDPDPVTGKCSYTVLSVRYAGDELLYGNYDYKGMKIEVKK